MNRRQFLSLSSRTATAALLAPPLSAWSAAFGADRTAWPMHLSTSSRMFPTLQIEEVCQQIAQLGFEAIDIWSPFANCNHLEEISKRLGAEGLKDLLAKQKLKLCAFTCYGGGHFQKYAEMLGKVGGALAIRGSAPAGKPEELTTRMREFLEQLKPMAELAAQNNSRLAIENHNGSLLYTLDGFKAFMDLNKSPQIGIALAPWHLQTAKLNVEEVIQLCGPQLLYFYAWQVTADGRASGFTQLPGHGPVDFIPWLKALARVNYTGYVNPFMQGTHKPEEMAEAIAKSRDYLKECHRKAVTE